MSEAPQDPPKPGDGPPVTDRRPPRSPAAGGKSKAVKYAISRWQEGRGSAPFSPRVGSGRRTDPASELHELATEQRAREQKRRKRKRRRLSEPFEGDAPRRNGAPAAPDPGLAAIEDLMQTPLGRVWLTDDMKEPSGGHSPPPPRAKRTGTVAPLPRRKRLAVDPEAHASPDMAKRVHFEGRSGQALLRLFVWLWGACRYFGGMFLDQLRGTDDIHRRAVRLRETLQSLGPTFVKFGQQLAVRADLLDYVYCQELSKMLDNVPPIEPEVAIAIIERSTGKPLGETFAVFDPEPIGSASLACVYQAVLHDGARVAIKVRRPNIGQLFAADLRAAGWLMEAAEALTLIRPGLTANLRSELTSMLMEEINFRQEARYTDIFRRRARKEGYDWITAPAVYFDLSGEEIIVTEFVSGVFMSEIVTALDRKDEASLTMLAEKGIDPVILAKRMCMAFNWETHESILFHADPHPANLVVRPGNVIVFIDFGSCGRFSSKSKRLWNQLHYYLTQEDVQGMVECSIALLEPLPPIDLERYSKEIEAVYWDWLYACKSKHSEWWEKASGVMWLRFVAVARRYSVPMNLDTMRMFRATFLYDTIMYRLWNGLDMDREYVRYYRRVGKKVRRRVQREFTRRLFRGLTDNDYHLIDETHRMARQMMHRIQHALDAPNPHFGHVLSKAAFAVSGFLRLTALAVIIHIAAFAVVEIVSFLTGYEITVWDAFLRVASTKTYQAAMLVVSLVVIRKTLIRFEDVDVK